MDIHHDLQVSREGQPEPTVSALAAYAAGLREALEGLRAEVSAGCHTDAPVEELKEGIHFEAVLRADAALALPLPDAAKEVEQIREKAKKAEGLGEHCRQLRLALADALTIVFAELPPQPHEGGCGGPDSQCDQACADAANAYAEYRRLFKVKNDPPHHFEQQAAEMREKAGLLDWMEEQEISLQCVYNEDGTDTSYWDCGIAAGPTALAALRAAKGKAK